MNYPVHTKALQQEQGELVQPVEHLWPSDYKVNSIHNNQHASTRLPFGCGDRRRTAISEWTSRRAMCHLFWCSAGYFRKELRTSRGCTRSRYPVPYSFSAWRTLVIYTGMLWCPQCIHESHRCGPGEDVGGSINGFVTNPSKGRLLHVTAQLTLVVHRRLLYI